MSLTEEEERHLAVLCGLTTNCYHVTYRMWVVKCFGGAEYLSSEAIDRINLEGTWLVLGYSMVTEPNVNADLLDELEVKTLNQKGCIYIFISKSTVRPS